MYDTEDNEHARKAIQIAPCPHDKHVLYAVCDDGSIWKINTDAYRADWHHVKQIPQDQIKYWDD